MKKTIIPILVFLFMALHAVAQSADEQISEAINSEDYFLLNERYPVLKDEIQTPMLKTLSESLLNDVFNRPQQAVKSTDELISNYQGELGFGNIMNMMMRQNNILFRMGEYCDASNRANSFIEQTASFLDTTTLKSLRAGSRIFDSMCGQKKSELVRHGGDCVIPIYIEPFEVKNYRKGSVLYLPVTANGIEERFILDTGCPGGLFLSEEYARKLGVKVVVDSLMVSGVGADWGKMGMLDSINVGNMTFKNLIVTIVPPNPVVDTVFKMNAVLGTDIMKHAGEIQIYPKEGKVIFPVNKTPLPSTGRNMITLSDHFYVKAYSGGEILIMHFDTGNSSAGLNSKYYQKHKSTVENTGAKGSSLSGGFGGIRTFDFYTIPSIPLRVGDKAFEMKDITVGTDDSGVLFMGQGKEDGALGMSFINLFDKVTINFDDMFVQVE